MKKRRLKWLVSLGRLSISHHAQNNRKFLAKIQRIHVFSPHLQHTPPPQHRLTMRALQKDNTRHTHTSLCSPFVRLTQYSQCKQLRRPAQIRWPLIRQQLNPPPPPPFSKMFGEMKMPFVFPLVGEIGGPLLFPRNYLHVWVCVIFVVSRHQDAYQKFA